MSKFVNSTVPVQNQNEKFLNLYNHYKWTNGHIAANIRAKKLTPIFQGSQDKNEQYNTKCEICYYYYPKINQTTCCFQRICTECIAATIDPNTLTCPYCRKNIFNVTPNQTRADLKNDDADDENYEKYEKKVKDGFDFEAAEGCSDESIAIALQFQVNVKEVNELLNAGLTIDEIIQSFSRPNTNSKNDVAHSNPSPDTSSTPKTPPALAQPQPQQSPQHAVSEPKQSQSVPSLNLNIPTPPNNKNNVTVKKVINNPWQAMAQPLPTDKQKWPEPTSSWQEKKDDSSDSSDVMPL
ncbi:hypothetical protein TRFO_11879 [Tritrichomonas foetus]|uniref:RING-type domain-containing protein n=1 Tax=Tritrichomonas foetus TaxID=1144522 RepID=A0A1J4J3F7_9EUKA|nr:hypothetical protein TRFO_11879 [Tritrichomonas foetus]|eukprot:OHS93273.1 hypothetical protein TRFO_11879 [Tritrichomonas foetus]